MSDTEFVNFCAVKNIALLIEVFQFICENVWNKIDAKRRKVLMIAVSSLKWNTSHKKIELQELQQVKSYEKIEKWYHNTSISSSVAVSTRRGSPYVNKYINLQNN